MAAITVEQYLLLKNTLNVQLSVALQKITVCSDGNTSQAFNYSTHALVDTVKKLEECLLLLDKCVKKSMSFIDTAVALEPFILLEPR